MTDEFDFRAREEQLRALDAKLSAQNSMFVQRAESLLKAQGQRLRSTSSDADIAPSPSSSNTRPPSSSGRSSSRQSNNVAAAAAAAASIPVISRTPSSPSVHRATSSHTNTNSAAIASVTSPSRGGASSRPVSRHIVAAPSHDDDLEDMVAATAAVSSSLSSSRRHFDDNNDNDYNNDNYGDDNDGYGAPIAASSRASRVPTANTIGAAAAAAAVDDEATDTLTGVGADAAQRYNRARIAALQTSVDKLTQVNAAQDKELNALTAKMKVLEDERKRLKRLIAQGEQTAEKQRQATSTAEEKALRLQREIDTLKRDLSVSDKARKQLELDSKNRDVRLNRAVAEADRLRVRSTRATEDKSGESQAQRQLVTQLRADNKRLVTQKAELLSAFRKQFKLIDILKRQKLHMEAARLLAFTEEEFAKTLELGDT